MAIVKKDGDETFQGTVGELAIQLNVDRAGADGLIKVLEAHGVAVKSGSQKSKAGKGKPSIVWTIPKKITMEI